MKCLKESVLVGTLLLAGSFAEARETTPHEDLLSPVLGENYKCSYPTKIFQGEYYECYTPDKEFFSITETRGTLWGKIHINYSEHETLPLLRLSNNSQHFKDQLSIFKSEVRTHVAGRIFADSYSNPRLLSEYGRDDYDVNFGSKYLVSGDYSGVTWDVAMGEHSLNIDWQYAR